MNLKEIIAISAMATLAVGCTSEELTPAGTSGRSGTVTCVMEPETRSYAAVDGTFTWTAGDAISLFDTDGRNHRAELSGGEGTKNATFATAADPERSVYAAYPYNASHSVSGDKVTLKLETTYTYDDATTPSTNAPMVGVRGDNGDYTFRHVAGALRVALMDAPKGLTSVVLRSTSGKKLSGFAGELDLGGDDMPSLTNDGTSGCDYVELSFGKALADTTDLVLFFPLPTGEYDGFTISLMQGATTLASYKNSKSNRLSRGELAILPPLLFTKDSDELTTMDDMEQLRHALKRGGSYTLSGDITVPEGESLMLGRGMTLHLNLGGHTLKLTSYSELYSLGDTLTINGPGTIDGRENKNSVYLIRTTSIGNVLSLNDLSVHSYKTSVYSAGKRLIINNCEIDNNYYEATCYGVSMAPSEMTVEIDNSKITSRIFGIYCPKEATVTVRNTTMTSSSGDVSSFSDGTPSFYGGTYSDLTALPFVKEGPVTVNLSKDCSIAKEGYTEIAVPVTLNIGSHKITLSGSSKGIRLSGDGSVVKGTKWITSSTATGRCLTIAGKTTLSGSLTVNSSSEEPLSYPIYVDEGGDLTIAGAKVTSGGCGVALSAAGASKSSKLTMKSGSVSAVQEAVKSVDNSNAEVVMEGGTLTSTSSFAMYLSHCNGGSVISGGTVTGLGAVAVSAGTLTVSGGTLSATSTSQTLSSLTGDGVSGLEYAVLSAPARYGDVTVTIDGGSFYKSGAAEMISRFDNNGKTAHKSVVSVGGGTFNADPSAYLSTSASVTQSDGVYVVTK
jgi:hypothetical protein